MSSLLIIFITGIARPDGCTLEGHKYNPSDPNSKDFAYYKCLNVFYHQLAIESMDEDKMSRRLSPVAVRARNANGKKFIDLINGPQDHGCCSGYLCLKRLSTFMAILPDGNYRGGGGGGDKKINKKALKMTSQLVIFRAFFFFSLFFLISSEKKQQ